MGRDTTVVGRSLGGHSWSVSSPVVVLAVALGAGWHAGRSAAQSSRSVTVSVWWCCGVCISSATYGEGADPARNLHPRPTGVVAGEWSCFGVLVIGESVQSGIGRRVWPVYDGTKHPVTEEKRSSGVLGRVHEDLVQSSCPADLRLHRREELIGRALQEWLLGVVADQVHHAGDPCLPVLLACSMHSRTRRSSVTSATTLAPPSGRLRPTSRTFAS
jgi:hypothetical protein